MLTAVKRGEAFGRIGIVAKLATFTSAPWTGIICRLRMQRLIRFLPAPREQRPPLGQQSGSSRTGFRRTRR
jgi:hypothetical protein